MRTAIALLPLVLTLGGCAWERTAGGQKTYDTWNCPPGSYPDEAYPQPNCDGLVRPAGNVVAELPADPNLMAARHAKDEEARQETIASVRHDAESAAQQDAVMQALVDEQAARDALEAARIEADAIRQQNLLVAQDARRQAVEESPDVVFEGRVPFPKGSGGLTEASAKELDDVAAAVANDPALVSVRIDGHANELDGRFANEKLSGQRAQAVRDYLEQQGVPSEKLEVRVHGKSREEPGVEIVVLAQRE